MRINKKEQEIYLYNYQDLIDIRDVLSEIVSSKNTILGYNEILSRAIMYKLARDTSSDNIALFHFNLEDLMSQNAELILSLCDIALRQFHKESDSEILIIENNLMEDIFGFENTIYVYDIITYIENQDEIKKLKEEIGTIENELYELNDKKRILENKIKELC